MIAHAIQGRNIERNGTVLQLSTLSTPLVLPVRRRRGRADRHVGDARRHDAVDGRERCGHGRSGPAPEDWATYEARMLTADDARASRWRRCATTSSCSRGGTPSRSCSRAASPAASTLAPVNTVADVMAIEQLAVRDYWDERHPAERPGAADARGRSSRRRRPRSPGRRPAPDGRRAHRRGARTRCSRRSSPRAPRCRRSRPSRRLPLEGVKVADFSWIGVGPITAKALADHGATVVHVESDAPADRLRLVGPFKDDIAGINRCQFFGVVQHVEAVAAARPQAPRRQRRRPAAAGVVRRRARLVHRRHDGQPRPRLRRRPRAQPGHHHGHDLPVRPDRPGRPARRLRLPRRRGERLLRDHRLGRPPAGRPVQRLHRHDRAALPDRRCCSPRSTTAAAPARGSSSTRRRWSRRCTSSPRSCSTCSCPGVSARRNGNHDPHRRAARRLPVRRRRPVVRDRRRVRRAVAGAARARSASRRGRWMPRSTRVGRAAGGPS